MAIGALPKEQLKSILESEFMAPGQLVTMWELQETIRMRSAGNFHGADRIYFVLLRGQTTFLK